MTALKTAAFKLLPGCKLDEKVYWLHKLLRMSLTQMVYFFYPRIYRVTDIGIPDVPYFNYSEQT